MVGAIASEMGMLK